MENTSTKNINKILWFTLLVFSISIIFVVSKYIGLIRLINKVISSLLPVFIAIFISFILEPLIGLFIKRGIRRKYGVLLAYSLVLISIIAIFYFTIPSLVKQIDVFVGNIPNLISTINNFFANLGLSFDGSKFINSVNDILIDVSKGVIDYICSSFSALFNLILGVSGAIFLSFDFPKFREGVKKHLPNRIKKPTIYYFHNLLPFINKYFMGMLLDSILIFIISIISFSIIGIDYTLVVAIFIAITNLIPIIGPYIGGIPAAIIGFSMSSTLGISAIIVVIIVQIIESNFLQPLILKNIIKLHPLEGILGISLFGTLFGIVGMILSPILVLAIKLLFLPYCENEEEGLSVAGNK